MKKLFIAFIVILNSCSEINYMNPFLEEYNTPYQIPPFEKIKNTHYLPAFTQGMKEQLE